MYALMRPALYPITKYSRTYATDMVPSRKCVDLTHVGDATVAYANYMLFSHASTSMWQG